MSEEVEMSSNASKEAEDTTININYYRKIVRTYLKLNRFKTAQFWAEKVVNLSKEDDEDMYWLAFTLYSSKEYHRAAHLITSKNLEITDAQCCYLAASCLSHTKQHNEALVILAASAGLIDEETTVCFENAERERDIQGVTLRGNALLSCITLERGRVYEDLENREFAALCFKEALKADVYCYEAFESLIQHQMLSSKEEASLIASLPFAKHCASQVDQELVRYLYESKLNKYRSINTFETTTPAWLVARLENSLDQKVAEAERHYYNCNISQCHRITQEVMSRDPYHMGCLPVHLSCLVEQKNSNDLFLLSHRLVEIYPENGISWFAIGCYYYVIGKNDCARRYLAKATTLDRSFGPAWLAYGHSFAADSEHDQAMAAYFKAAQLMIGCHLPLLYIGLENGLTNNTPLAEKFFLQANQMAPDDPFVLHEMGVIAFQCAQYEKAKKYMEEALKKITVNDKCILQRKWEPLLNNLGHVYRKLLMYDKALECHMQAMVLMPNSFSTYAAIGFCESLSGQRTKSIETFHKALSLKRDDTFSTTMLNYVLEQHIQDGAKDNSDEVILASTKDLRSSAKHNLSEVDDVAMQLVRSSCEEMRQPMYRSPDRSAGSTFMSTEPSFVDVTNTHAKF